MKLKSARIKNFKLLKDVRIEFSIDGQQPLTVIRAENGSGKTSTLMALRWALYGQDGLDDPTMRLSRAGWPSGQECEISVQLDFSHTLYSIIAGESVGVTTDYRLIRTVTERPDGDRPNRGSDRVVLYESTDRGLEKKDESLIGDMLPIEMKDIFFTDGDAALTFISPQLSRASRRTQVKEAIRSLLGLGLLEAAGGHIAKAKRRFNSEVSNLSGAGKLTEITQQLTQAEDKLTQDTERLRDVERQIEDLVRRHDEADKHLQLALQAGDYDELVQQEKQARSQLSAAKENEIALKERHRQLLQDERLSLVLIGPTLDKGFGELAKLHHAGVIPSASIPVLEERIVLKSCICGTPLTDGSEARKHVQDLIATQRTIDDERRRLTELYHAAKVDLQRETNAARDWTRSLETLERTRLNNRKARQTAENQLKVLGEKIRRIDKGAITDVRKSRDSLLTSLTAKQDERRDLQAEIDKWRSIVDELTPQQASLRRQDRKLSVLNSRLTVTEDMTTIVRGALDDLEQIYLSRVSQRLNDLFLEMVGADPASMAELAAGQGKSMSQVIVGAAITPDSEIVVYSDDNRTLNPENELSGAQKRALTFSFIWALTEVSQVVAPRIIDTPLGMMSGRVKQRVLELITTPSSSPADVEKQVVLFLTRDEIRGIESIIDARAGRVMTFTNTDQFPVDVVNNPNVGVPEVLRCECNHRQFCVVCARRNDDQYGLIERPIV